MTSLERLREIIRKDDPVKDDVEEIRSLIEEIESDKTLNLSEEVSQELLKEAIEFQMKVFSKVMGEFGDLMSGDLDE